MSLATPRKGYKSVKWLFGKEIEIPEEWVFENLSGVSKRIWIGLVTTMTKNYVEKGIPLIRNSDIGENKIKLKDLIYLNNNFALEHKSRSFEMGDVITVHTGNVGISAIIPKQLIGAHGFATLNTRTNPKIINNYYFATFLNSNLFQKQTKKVVTGDGRDNLNLKDFIKLKIIFPSKIQEQQKIVTILSNVDNLIESTGKVITHSKKVKTGLMQKLLTQGIGHTKFKDTRFGKLPEEWNIIKIGKISLIIDTPHYTSPNYESGIPIIRTSDCDTNGRINYSKTKFTDKSEYENRRQHIDPNVGDILFTREAPCGIAVLVDTKEIAVGQRIILLKTDLEQILNSFMVLFLNSFYGRYQTKIFAISTTVERVNISDIKKFLIPLPPLPEQQKIATILSNIDSKITSQEQYKEKLEKLKKSLMQKLLTGEVRV